MKKRATLFSIIVLLLLSLFIFIFEDVKAHEGIDDVDLDEHEEINVNFEIFSRVKWISFFIGITIFFSAFFYYSHKKGLNAIERRKHIAFSFIVTVVSLLALYILFTTLYINAVSYSKGLVHWHADFTIEICEKEIKLPESGNRLVNRVGNVHYIRTRALINKSVDEFTKSNHSILLNPVIASNSKEQNLILAPSEREMTSLSQGLEEFGGKVRLVTTECFEISKIHKIRNQRIRSFLDKVPKKELLNGLQRIAN